MGRPLLLAVSADLPEGVVFHRGLRLSRARGFSIDEPAGCGRILAAEALARGEPNRKKIALTAISNVVRELV